MKTIKNGYTPGALLMIPFVRKLRDHVEYEKFLCRMMIDNETTQEFKTKTENLPDALYRLRYNNKNVVTITAEGRNAGNTNI